MSEVCPVCDDPADEVVKTGRDNIVLHNNDEIEGVHQTTYQTVTTSIDEVHVNFNSYTRELELYFHE